MIYFRKIAEIFGVLGFWVVCWLQKASVTEKYIFCSNMEYIV